MWLDGLTFFTLWLGVALAGKCPGAFVARDVLSEATPIYKMHWTEWGARQMDEVRDEMAAVADREASRLCAERHQFRLRK